MNVKLALLGAATLLLTCTGARSQGLPNNFWPNSYFDNGTNLASTNGTPTGWVRNGSDTNIDQVTPVDLPNSTNAVVENDQDGGNYGEWDGYVNLAGIVNPGDTINIQYDAMWSVQDGQMRVAVGFLDVNDQPITYGQFVVEGDSPGWNGDIASSTFTETNQTLVVPIGAVTLNVGVVSGGPAATTGYLVVDDLFVARAPTPDLLPGNFWPNPSFESGTNLDQTNGVPTGWNVYNSGPDICQVTTNNYVSATHALELVDNDPANYGSWYSDMVSLTGHANPGDTLDLQWFQLYSISNDNMRVTFSFYNSANNDVDDISYQVTGNSPGWQGTVEGSGFTKVNQFVTVPPNATQLLVQLVSGGGGDTTGIMLMDDLSIAPPQAPSVLPGNFWPNPGFEQGVNLDQTNGTPAGWVRNFYGDPAIEQVSTANSTSPTHSLAVIDNETTNYGEWDADLTLAPTNAVAGDLVNIQYSALYNITNGPMRLTVQFFDASSNTLSSIDFNMSGQSSGWAGSIASSSFTVETQQVTVPVNAVRMRFALVSGGPELATGVLLIDDLSAAVQVVPPLPPTVLAGNFFPNPTFEEGVALDNPTLGLPTGGWQRGGSSATIDQITTNNSTSPTHSLELLDDDINNYGEWYMFLDLTGAQTNNASLDIQWFQLYNVTNGTMRLSFALIDGNGNTYWSQDNNTSANGTNAGWEGTVENSTFDREFETILVPPGATELRVNLASGGASSVTGVMLIDDLSVRVTPLAFTTSNPATPPIVAQAGGYNLTWNSAPSQTYSVLFTSALTTNPMWSVLASNIPGSFSTNTSYLDTANHGASNGFYLIEQQ
jgi:hypothetical protein